MKALIFAFAITVIGLGYSQGALAEATKPKLETATFAAGCFWGSEEFFRKIPGVVETRVGYAGGTVPNPKYEDTHDGHTGHAESVEIKFDPTKVSYEHLLDQFFKIHDPTTLNRQGNDTGNQYRSAIFYHDEEQKKEAMAFKAKVEKSGAWKHPIVTEVAQAKTFWPAEEYHQKYLQKHPGGYDNHYLRDIIFDKFDKSKK
jgi:methionine-S-sulfoxide reductase